MHLYKKIRFVFVLLIFMLLTACGQSGPLYLPTSDHSAAGMKAPED